MKIYKLEKGVGIQTQEHYYELKGFTWDSIFQKDDILAEFRAIIKTLEPITEKNSQMDNILPPIQSQEVWASGVTYYNSKLGRQEESKDSGGGDYYEKVYHAERPELFFKATAARTVGHGGLVRIRKDSTWNVPEPELTLAISSKGKIIGYTIGNDMSSRSIEGENPLYLPQAKSYDGSAALGPCIYLTDKPLPASTSISIDVIRGGQSVFNESIAIDQIKRKLEGLVGYLYRECSFPFGSYLMTGTGIVPPSDFTLQSGDLIHIDIDQIGRLSNQVS